MATTTATNAPKAATARTASADVTASGAEVQVKGVNRREFLYYIWGASMALLLAETGGAIVWFALPRFREGEFGGVFTIDPATLPPTGSAPVLNAAGKYWLSNTADGVLALSAVCTHLGCLFKWSDVNTRFECPCHGSKFQADGSYIEGPAPRGLDRFELTVIAGGTSTVTDANGDPVPANGATSILINTGKKLKIAAHA